MGDLSGISSLEGKFEDFKVLGALLELNIGGCKKIDCKNALEVLPTMPWAAQIQKLRLSGTDAEGDIKALEKCTQLTSVNFYECRQVTGDIKVLEKCTQLTSVNVYNTYVQGDIKAL